jgi:hypothetical protein
MEIAWVGSLAHIRVWYSNWQPLYGLWGFFFFLRFFIRVAPTRPPVILRPGENRAKVKS